MRLDDFKDCFTITVTNADMEELQNKQFENICLSTVIERKGRKYSFFLQDVTEHRYSLLGHEDTKEVK